MTDNPNFDINDLKRGITATIKAGKNYDDPWIVFHAIDPDDLVSQLNEAGHARLYEAVSDAANTFYGTELNRRPDTSGAGGYKPPQGRSNSGGGSGGYNRPQGGGNGGQAPSGPPANHDLVTTCRHGEKVYVSGISQRTNKPWFGFDCAQNYKTNECARFAKVE